MGDEDKEVTTRIYESDRELLNNLSSKYGMKASVILGHIIGKASEYNILEEGWEIALAEKEFQDMLKDADIDFRKKVELKKVDAQIKAKMLVFKEWLNVLGPPEKKQFLENVLGDTKAGDFLEKLTNYQMFLIDGIKRLYPVDDQGYPVIAFTRPEEIIQCLRGYHVLNNRCDCRYWETCEYGKAAYEEWLSVHGSQLEQRRYLEQENQKYRRSLSLR